MKPSFVSDCYSGQSTRGVAGGRVSGWGSQDQELDVRNTLRPVFAVLLWFLECCEKKSLPMGLPMPPLYRLGFIGVQGMICSGCFTREEVG